MLPPSPRAPASLPSRSCDELVLPSQAKSSGCRLREGRRRQACLQRHNKLLKSPNFVVLGDDDALCKDFYSTLREAARSDSSTEGVEEFYLKSVLETPLSQQVHAKR